MIGIVGLSYRKAPLAVREKLVFNQQEAIELMTLLQQQFQLQGTVLVSTCNRTELYFTSAADQEWLPKQIRNAIILYKQLDIKELSPFFFSLTKDDCIRHLFRVTSGLDSMIIGEYQVLGQIKDAFRLSAENNLHAPMLSRLFHKAFEIGKAARNTYRTNSVSASAGEKAVQMVAGQFANIGHLKILVVGAGQTARSVLNAIQPYNCQHLAVINRDNCKAQMIAEEYQIESNTWENLTSHFQQSDVVFVTTASTNPVITPSMVLMNYDSSHSQVLFDLSVPRNIDPQVGSMQNITLLAIDDLSQNQITAVVAEDIQAIESRISEGIEEFNEWLTSLNLSPTIELLQKRFNEVLDRRLQFIENKVSEDEYQAATQTGKYLTDKYLQMIIHSLRHTSENGRHTSYIDLMNQLLKLSDN